MRISFDTPFDDDFPVMTRANAGEILPHVLTPLAWSILGPPLEEGFRVSFCDDMHAIDRPGPNRPYVLTGKLAGRFHLNLSAIRTVGERVPGTSAAAVDQQYMGDASLGDLPAHEPSADDRRWRVRAAPAVGRTMAGMGRRVDRDAELVAESADALDDLLGDEPEAVAAPRLIREIRRRQALLAHLLGTHITARSLTSPMLEQAVSALGRAGVDPDNALRYVADIDDLESSKPATALETLARSLDRAGLVASTIAATPTRAALAALDDPEAERILEALDGFVDEFGHRGVGEYDPTVPAWAQRPDDVVSLLARLVTTTPRAEPAVDEPAGDDRLDPGRIARPLVAAARAAIHRAERTKNHCILVSHQLRRLVWLLDDRLDIPLRLCTLDELESTALGAEPPAAAELERRATELAEVETLSLAEWSAGEIRTVSPDEAHEPDGDGDGPTLTGIAGSSGTVTARVRILRSPYDELHDGEVLVAHMTDTAWTPLFLAASAVVTDVGGVLSHATIVARDLGIPAVVNVKVATTSLTDGTLVEVDGTAGVVRVVDAR